MYYTRPSVRHPPAVVAVLRQCFESVPRMNCYDMRKMLLKYFLMGPRVLRIAQISGRVTSEVKRRKKGLLTAVASAENQAMSNTEPDNKSAELSESELQTTVQEANIYMQHGKKTCA